MTSNILEAQNYKNKHGNVLENVENKFSLLFPLNILSNNLYFAEFFVTGCLIMTSPFWSLLLCSVLILANLSSIHDAVYS